MLFALRGDTAEEALRGDSKEGAILQSRSHNATWEKEQEAGRKSDADSFPEAHLKKRLFSESARTSSAEVTNTKYIKNPSFWFIFKMNTDGGVRISKAKWLPALLYCEAQYPPSMLQD